MTTTQKKNAARGFAKQFAISVKSATEYLTAADFNYAVAYAKLAAEVRAKS